MVGYSAVIAALNDTGRDVTKAAKRLGISRRQLQRDMREYNIPEGKPGRKKQTRRYSRGSRLATGLGVAVAAVGAVALGLKLRRGTPT